PARWLGDSSGRYSPRVAYGILRGTCCRVPWWPLVWNSATPPRLGFILWLVLHERIRTKDRLLRMGIG
ncbi:hypothetical protein Dimus_030123, partial [Dionaea muscipula]